MNHKTSHFSVNREHQTFICFVCLTFYKNQLRLLGGNTFYSKFYTKMATHILVLVTLNLTLGVLHAQSTQKAVAVLESGNVTGVITFTQTDCRPQATLEVKVSGLTPGLHGLHIHEKGDLSGGCDTLLTHYNPFNQTHGARTDVVRHAGDLGNIEADAQGNVNVSITDRIVSLCGSYSVVGRGIIIHSGTDDLGRGGNEESLKTGNSGGRVACGIIGWA